MASAAALVVEVEVDGDAYHAERRAADGRSDEALRQAGYRVLRAAGIAGGAAALALAREAPAR